MKTETENNVIQTLNKCITACETCLTMSIQEGLPASLRDSVNLQRDCIDICALTARFISRSSANMRRIIKECIEICRKCAEECYKQSQEHYQLCGDICQECYQTCEKYLQKETAINSKWL
ncbi:four-helix bundle copper-binding protein [Rhodocytophaga rosea]|uniref:Four-helix bundle copper-binding protein n=1 Tax=Rhodocytophaga rosea TaxID=2704465 RepID=A0A6C0GUG3_9BACT|nr:four-helix bundle copper-binding protein [Rhodocytophaga rosea]